MNGITEEFTKIREAQIRAQLHTRDLVRRLTYEICTSSFAGQHFK